MKKYILPVIILCMITSVGFAQSAQLEEEITKKEKAMYEAIQSGDMETFERNLSDEFVSIYSAGMVNKDEEIENINNLTMNSFELSNIRVMSPAENVAIIMYEVASDGEYMGDPFSGTFYSSSTWVKNDGDWKAIMHTETRAEPVGARAEAMDDYEDEEESDVEYEEDDENGSEEEEVDGDKVH